MNHHQWTCSHCGITAAQLAQVSADIMRNSHCKTPALNLQEQVRWHIASHENCGAQEYAEQVNALRRTLLAREGFVRVI